MGGEDVDDEGDGDDGRGGWGAFLGWEDFLVVCFLAILYYRWVWSDVVSVIIVMAWDGMRLVVFGEW